MAIVWIYFAGRRHKTVFCVSLRQRSVHIASAGQHDDARMNVALAITAVRYGASVANYTEVVNILKTKDDEGKEVVTGACVRDRMTGREWNIKAKCVINATGPYTDRIRTLGNETVRKICQPSSGVHVILPDYYRLDYMLLLLLLW